MRKGCWLFVSYLEIFSSAFFLKSFKPCAWATIFGLKKGVDEAVLLYTKAEFVLQLVKT